MPQEPLRLIISSKDDGGKPIPLSVIANSFQKIQALVYILGDQKEGNQFRTKGDYPNHIKDRYELALSRLDIGSADTYIIPVSSDQTLDGEVSPAEFVISQVTRIISTISTAGEGETVISEIIPDERRRKRFTRELMDLWPDNQTPYSYQIAHGPIHLTPLIPEQRQVLSRLQREYQPIHEVKNIYGRIISLFVDEKRKIIIETPEGELFGHYSLDIEDVLREHLGRFIHFEATLKLKNGKFFVEMDDSIIIDQIQTFPLVYVTISGRERRLSSPLLLSVEYSDGTYHLENTELLIETYATRLKDAMDQISDQLELLYLEYCTCDLDELTSDAIDLRRTLLVYFEG